MWRGHNLSISEREYRERFPDGPHTKINLNRLYGKDILTDVRERQPMSNTLWCDIPDPLTDTIGQKGHPFSEKDPERQHFTQTRLVQVNTGNSYGKPTYQQREEVTEELDICGYHWRKQNPFHAVPEISEGPSGKHQKTLDELQKENDDWQAGYDAAIDSIATGK